MAVFGVADGNLVVSGSAAPEPGLSLPWQGVHTRAERWRRTHTERGRLIDVFVLWKMAFRWSGFFQSPFLGFIMGGQLHLGALEVITQIHCIIRH